MRTEPVFCGKIHVTTIKNGKYIWKDFKTNKKSDEKILEISQKICPNEYTWERQAISQEDGNMFRKVIEKTVGQNLDIPENAAYSVTYSKVYNPVKKRDTHSILLFCEERFGKLLGAENRTAVDIYI